MCNPWNCLGVILGAAIIGAVGGIGYRYYQLRGKQMFRKELPSAPAIARFKRALRHG